MQILLPELYGAPAPETSQRICARQALGSWLVVGILVACRLLSVPFATVHCCLVQVHWQELPICIALCRDGVYATLCDIWATRFVREAVTGLLKTPLRAATLILVDAKHLPAGPGGCVIAVCHSPWFRWLAEWCRDRNAARVVAGDSWIWRTRGVNVLGGYHNVRALVEHLRSGGRAIVVADVFGDAHECEVRFLGVTRRVSLLPARLAALAGVPLVTLLPTRFAHRVRLECGPSFHVVNGNQDEVMRAMLAFYEREIRRRPALWSHAAKDASAYSTGGAASPSQPQ